MTNIIFKYNNTTISPAPKISINTDFIYANDSIIGNKYILNLQGIAMVQNDQSFASTLIMVEQIRSLLSQNGSVLLVLDSNNNELIKGIGGILLSLEFENTDNAWSKYANYTASLQFSELNILNDTFTYCDSLINSTNSLLNLNKYKIEEFNDSWDFNVQEDTFNFNDTSNLIVQNSQLGITYEISAIGKTYIDENENVVASWQSAKHFAQERLFDQIVNLYNVNILKLNGLTCSSSSSISDVYSYGSGLLTELDLYDICNETINCSTSESDGSFSATYNAILKFNDNANNSFGGRRAIHNFNKSTTTDFNGNKNVFTVRVDGTIQGLNSTNLITDLGFGGFSLPKNGKLIKGNDNFDKITNALIVMNKIITNEEDLSTNFKQALGITPEMLIPNSPPECSGINKVPPVSFSLTTNPFFGTINYNAEYTTDRTANFEDEDTVLYKTTVNVDSPVPVIVDLPMPNGNYIIQDTGAFTSKKISVSINARKKQKDCCLISPTGFYNNLTLQDILNTMNTFILPGSNFILTGKKIAYNLVDNSYTMNVSYICQDGCPI